MEIRLKTISKASIPSALDKVDRYRLLNEPEDAESICLDILAADPEHQGALVRLGLAITDQFRGDHQDRFREAEQVFQRLKDPYERAYYAGLVRERRAKAQVATGHPPHTVKYLLQEAMRHFEEAEKLRAPGNDESILRWNRCARLLASRNWDLEKESFPAGDF
jgi:tetratricopeptide (TPR) repeat protein